MELLRSLPHSHCQLGPEQVDGVGNYYLEIFNRELPDVPLMTVFLLDSHGQISSEVRNPDYEPIKQSQIDWFTNTSQELREQRASGKTPDRFHPSLAFLHIPLPEFGDTRLMIEGGRRREPTEGPSSNSHFYDALKQESIVAVGCGHDHVNDFCGLIPHNSQSYSSSNEGGSPLGPWLCHGGSSGFGGYCSYGEERYHRRTRIWEFDTDVDELKTWKRIEYSAQNVDELVLAAGGKLVAPARSQFKDEGEKNAGEEL